MLKVCFLSWHFATPEVFLNTLIKMTPKRSGKWGNIEAITDPEKADFCIVFDGYNRPFPEERAIYCGQQFPIRKFENKKALLKLSLDRFLNLGEWWVDYDYDALIGLPKPPKTRNLTCILTYKPNMYQYMRRINFMCKFCTIMAKTDNKQWIDIWGRPQHLFEREKALEYYYKGPLGNNKPNVLLGEHTIGKEILLDYNYSIEFDLGPAINYITERFYDSLLMWTMPIYYGSNNVHQYFPKESFHYVNLDTNTKEDIEKEIHKVLAIVSNPPTQENIKAIAEARDLILNKYQTWAYVHDVVNNLEKYK